MSLSNEVKALAESIKTGLSMDSQTGHVDAGDDIWEKNLPEDLDKETIKKVKDHEANFTAASYLAIGQLAVDAFKSNKDLQRTEGEIKMHGHDKVIVAIDRERTFPDPSSKGSSVTKVAAGKVNFHNVAGRNTGDMKAAMKEITRLAQEAKIGK